MRKAIQRNARLAESVFESITSLIVVTNELGIILYLNDKWRELSKNNGANKDVTIGIGLNYIEICYNAKGPNKEYAQKCASGLEKILSEKLTFFEIECPCHGPNGIECWYLLRIVPYNLQNDETGAIITHIDISKIKFDLIKLQSQCHELEERLEKKKKKNTQKSKKLKATRTQLAQLERKAILDSLLMHTDDKSVFSDSIVIDSDSFVHKAHLKSGKKGLHNDWVTDFISIVNSTDSITFSPHQRSLLKVRWSRLTCHTLLLLGLRKPAISLCHKIYNWSIKTELYEIASDMAFEMARHYTLYECNAEIGNTYWNLYLKAKYKCNVSRDTLYKCAEFLTTFKAGDQIPLELEKSIDDTIEKLEKKEGKNISHDFLLLLYLLKIYRSESQLDFNKSIEIAKKGYDFYDMLIGDHLDEKLMFLTYIMSAQNVLENYQEVLGYTDLVNKIGEGSPYYAKCVLHLIRAAVNMKDYNLAFEYSNLKGLVNSADEEIMSRRQLYLMYAFLLTKQYEKINFNSIISSKRNGKMSIAIRIVHLWKNLMDNVDSSRIVLSNKKWIRRKKDKSTRSIVFIKLLCVYELKITNPELFYEKSEMLLKELKSLPPEGYNFEIINYEIAWDAICNQ